MRKPLLILAFAAPFLSGFAETSIDSSNRYAYGGNIGWLDAAADTNNGAVIGAYFCSGNIYSENTGWINLGSGSPANGLQYQNNSAADFGVNTDSSGNLRGNAYGANIGWITFESMGTPRVNLLTGKLSGSAWSANCGWISLSNSVAVVQTDTLSPGPLDTNNLPIAWELTYFGATGVDPNADPDHDGMSNYQEYLAGTNPTNAADNLAITASTAMPGGTNVTLTWRSEPYRYYLIQKTLSLSQIEWTDSGLGLITPSSGSETTATFTDTNARVRFYRVQAIQPLAQ